MSSDKLTALCIYIRNPSDTLQAIIWNCEAFW